MSANFPRVRPLMIQQPYVHDHARRAEAGRNHDDLVHARLLPNPAENARGVPDAYQGEVTPSGRDSTHISLLLIRSTLYPYANLYRCTRAVEATRAYRIMAR
jgi:hypothetical protein